MLHVRREIREFIGQGDTMRDSRDNRFLIGECLLELKRNVWNSLAFTPENWDEIGFSVFSQSNEDGLIQYLINHIDIPNKTFVEFGVENYLESNTRFLLLHNNWSGLIMDGSKENMEYVKRDDICWKHDLEAVSAFITKDNINDLISSRGFDEEVGILSVDIDGNDYWVWDAINCIRPYIVICEFNPIFGSNTTVSIPYKPDFYRLDVHFSGLYWGASLGAYVQLGKKKGYKLVCINQLGHNVFFVREDIECSLPEVPINLAYREAKYRESFDEKGRWTFLSHREGLELIGDKEVVDVTDGKLKKIRDCNIEF